MTTTEYPTSVTIPAGYEVRISAQTASRDYSAVAVPGTYPIDYTTTGYHSVDVATEHPYYACIRLQIVSPERTQSSVEYGGVPLAYETIPESTHAHMITKYAYEVRGKEYLGKLGLNYPGPAESSEEPTQGAYLRPEEEDLDEPDGYEEMLRSREYGPQF